MPPQVVELRAKRGQAGFQIVEHGISSVTRVIGLSPRPSGGERICKALALRVVSGGKTPGFAAISRPARAT